VFELAVLSRIKFAELLNASLFYSNVVPRTNVEGIDERILRFTVFIPVEADHQKAFVLIKLLLQDL